MSIKLNAKQLRTSTPDPELLRTVARNPITIILDNVLDTYNVGSIFRLADAVAAEKVVLCGQTLTPPNSRIKKASINTWEWVPWEYALTAKEAVEKCQTRLPAPKPARNASQRVAGGYRDSGLQTDDTCQIIVVEQDARSKPFNQVQYNFPVAIVVGNETFGVSHEVLEMADTIVEIPMWGINTSLNVMVSCGIILYEVMKQVPR